MNKNNAEYPSEAKYGFHDGADSLKASTVNPQVGPHNLLRIHTSRGFIRATGEVWNPKHSALDLKLFWLAVAKINLSYYTGENRIDYHKHYGNLI